MSWRDQPLLELLFRETDMSSLYHHHLWCCPMVSPPPPLKIFWIRPSAFLHFKPLHVNLCPWVYVANSFYLFVNISTLNPSNNVFHSYKPVCQHHLQRLLVVVSIISPLVQPFSRPLPQFPMLSSQNLYLLFFLSQLGWGGVVMGYVSYKSGSGMLT